MAITAALIIGGIIGAFLDLLIYRRHYYCANCRQWRKEKSS